MLSVIITVHNEGMELRRTVNSVMRKTAGRFEILIVDDGSTDSCCDGLESRQVRVIRNQHRQGVAQSRDQAVRKAKGDAVAFLDAHQRVTTHTLNQCAATARQHSAIITPDIRGFEQDAATVHGAVFLTSPDHGYFNARWECSKPRHRLSRVSSLRAPAYIIPRCIYDRVRWIQGLRSWGGSEAAVSLKAFFLCIPILHLCGPLTWHRFKQKLHYDASWDDVWRNHALIARVCFSDRSWFEYWLPCVFDAHLTEEAKADLHSELVVDQQREFNRVKVRSDTEFWTVLLHRAPPPELA